MIDPNKDAAPSADLHQEQGSQIDGIPGEAAESAPVVEIEVKNMKGRVQKIDLDDYEVMITSNTKRLLTANLSHISNGIYSDLSKKHGIRQALSELLNDFASSPNKVFVQPLLSFAQAKMVLLSLKTGGQLKDESIHEIIAKTNNEERKHLIHWIDKCRNL
jgi:hypothetical protein